MAIPTKERKAIFGFHTDGGFAKEFHVHPGTLSEWKLKPELWEVRDRYLVHFKKRTANIIAKLGDRAERTGEAFHVLSWAKLVEGFAERTGVDLTSKGQRITGFDVVIRKAKNSPSSSRKPAGGDKG